jgi:RimJ/RimL family protein N-acetyltransferase
VHHADEMVAVLGDRELHVQTGGEPPSLDELRSRYASQAVGQSLDGSRGWLNWIMRARQTGLAVGTVQATVWRARRGMCAELAWTVGVAHQHRGYAKEAANEMATWLRRRGADSFDAYIRPGHEASEGAAKRIGLRATAAVRDGETRWVSGGR